MEQVLNCFEYTLKRYTLKNLASVFRSAVCFAR